jgi:site-specific DNA recombinase
MAVSAGISLRTLNRFLNLAEKALEKREAGRRLTIEEEEFCQFCLDFHKAEIAVEKQLVEVILTAEDLAPQRGSFEPVVSEDLFRKVQRVLDGKAVIVTPHDRNHPDFPVRVFVQCGVCGTAMTGSWSKGRTSRYAYYRCRSSAVCKAANISKAELETAFMRCLQAMLPKPEYAQLFREIVLDVWNQRQAEARNTRRQLQSNFDSLVTKKDRIVDAFVHRRAIDQRTYNRQTAKLDEEIVLAESALHDARLDELDVEGVLNFAEYVLTNAARFWIEASPSQKQRLQKLLFPSGVTYSRDSGFGTAEISVIFRLLQSVGGQKSKEVSLCASSRTCVAVTQPVERRRSRSLRADRP